MIHLIYLMEKRVYVFRLIGHLKCMVHLLHFNSFDYYDRYICTDDECVTASICNKKETS